MSAADGACIVLGVGNVLLGDDGAGVLAARELERRAATGEARLPEGTRIIDGGTLGPALAPFIAGARAVVLLDAVDVGAPAGAVAVIDGPTLMAWEAERSMPATDGVGGLIGLAALAGLEPSALGLVGIQAGLPFSGTIRTAAVEAALPYAAAEAAATLDRIIASQQLREAPPGEAARTAAEGRA